MFKTRISCIYCKKLILKQQEVNKRSQTKNRCTFIIFNTKTDFSFTVNMESKFIVPNYMTSV